jgi:hypothetical protein
VGSDGKANYLFDEDDQAAPEFASNEEKKENYEDEKLLARPESQSEEAKVSIKRFLNDIFLHPVTDLEDNRAVEINQMKKLANDVLKLMWQFCMEEMVFS